MSQANARSLSNNFQDVRLVSLASWSKAAEIAPRDRNGPYVVMQEGYDPQDPTLKFDEFVLGRSGKWLSLALFYRLPVPDRRAEFLYGTAAEVMQTLGKLTGKVVVFRPDAPSTEAEPAPDAGPDEMATVLKASKSSDKPTAS